MLLVETFDPSLIPTIFLVLFFCLGLFLGSFATAIIHREQNGQSWFDVGGNNTRSACPSCGYRLSIGDLVPFFSWMFSKGKCRYCRTPVSKFYPATELVMGILAAGLYLVTGMGITLFVMLGMLPFVVSMLYLGVFRRLWSWRLFAIAVTIPILAFLLSHFLLSE